MCQYAWSVDVEDDHAHVMQIPGADRAEMRSWIAWQRDFKRLQAAYPGRTHQEIHVMAQSDLTLLRGTSDGQ
jgi:hypothetical protein